MAAAGGTIDSTSSALCTIAASDPTSTTPARAASARECALRRLKSVTTRKPARANAPPTALPMSPLPRIATVRCVAVVIAIPAYEVRAYN